MVQGNGTKEGRRGAHLLLGLLVGHGHCHHANAAANADASARKHDEAEHAQRGRDVLVHNHCCEGDAGGREWKKVAGDPANEDEAGVMGRLIRGIGVYIGHEWLYLRIQVPSGTCPASSAVGQILGAAICAEAHFAGHRRCCAHVNRCVTGQRRTGSFTWCSKMPRTQERATQSAGDLHTRHLIHDPTYWKGSHASLRSVILGDRAHSAVAMPAAFARAQEESQVCGAARYCRHPQDEREREERGCPPRKQSRSRTLRVADNLNGRAPAEAAAEICVW